MEHFQSEWKRIKDAILSGMNNFLNVGEKKIAKPVQGTNNKEIDQLVGETKLFVEKTGQAIAGQLESEDIIMQEPWRIIEGACQEHKYFLCFIPYEQVEKFDGYSKVCVGQLEFEAYCCDNGTIVSKNLVDLAREE